MRKINVGVLMDSLECSPYLYNAISDLAEDPSITLYLLQNNIPKNTNPVGRISQNIQDDGICGFANNIIFETCMSLERKMYAAATKRREYFLDVNLDTKVFLDQILINPILSKSVESNKSILVSYDNIDIQKIKMLNLDLILRGNAAGIFQGKILCAAKKGIISFYNDDNQWNRGGAPGFLEVYLKRPATDFSIRILNENGGDVIFRGEITTKSFYASNLVNLYQAASFFMTHIIKDYAATGNLPPTLPKNFSSNMPTEAPKLTTILSYPIQTYSTVAPPLLKRWILGRHRRWSVAYIMSDWTTADLSKATVIKNPKGRFLADPFVVAHASRTIIFAEDYHYSNDRGVISAVEIFSDGSYELIPDVIKEHFHLSFPYTFEYKGDLYMIPESCEARAIKLYKCIQFPRKWEYLYDIMEGISAVDTMVFEHLNKWWMLTNIAPDGTREYWQLCAFNADSPLSKEWQPHPQNPICFSTEFGRNGGILRDRSGTIYRVRQKQGFGRYGAAASIAKIARLDMECYDEVFYQRVEPKFLPNLVGNHHMHSDGTFTVFDFAREESLK